MVEVAHMLNGVLDLGEKIELSLWQVCARSKVGCDKVTTIFVDWVKKMYKSGRLGVYVLKKMI